MEDWLTFQISPLVKYSQIQTKYKQDEENLYKLLFLL